MLGSSPSLITSKQLYHLSLEGGICELSLPHPLLTSYIDYYWLLTIEYSTLLLEVIPDTAVDLVVSPDIPNFAALYFPVSEKFCIELEGPVRYAGICFRSSSAPDLFQLDLNTLAQLNIGADIIQKIKIERLLTDIKGAQSVSQVAEISNTFWLARLAQSSPVSKAQPRINHPELISVLENSMGRNSIANICNTLAVSERQFRRLSNDLFGISPKKLQKILRLQTALVELFQCESSQIQDFYYDDSHRIRDLKQLTGCTPMQIRRMAEKYNKYKTD